MITPQYIVIFNLCTTILSWPTAARATTNHIVSLSEKKKIWRLRIKVKVIGMPGRKLGSSLDILDLISC